MSGWDEPVTFAPKIEFGAIDLTKHPYSVEFGFDLDTPKTLYDVIASFMLDGSFAGSKGAGNREGMTLPVYIEWPDSLVGARRAEELELELEKPTNEVIFYPGDGAGPPTVLETFVGDIDHDYDQDKEQAGLRRYLLTIPALPFARAKELETFTWTGPGTEVAPLTALPADWTASPAPTPGDTGAGPFLEMSTTTTWTMKIRADNYIWMQLLSGTAVNETSVHDITVNGEPVDSDTVRFEAGFFYTIPTEKWQGQLVTVSMQINAFGGSHTKLKEFWTVAYPNPGAKTSGGISRPWGLDIVDVKGSVRTPCSIRFTAPAGGAFVISMPDPNAALRRGASEIVFANFTVTDPAGAEIAVDDGLAYFVEGSHQVTIGRTAPRPLELNPDGVFPQRSMQSFSGGGISTGFQYPFPEDRRAATTFFTTAGAKSLISPTPALKSGFRSDAAWHTIHSMHAGRCGFGVYDVAGNPITTEVSYYPRNRIHAAH